MLRYMIVGAAVVATVLSGCSSPRGERTRAEEPEAAHSRIRADVESRAAQNAPKASAPGGVNADIAPNGKAKITVEGRVLSLTGPVYCNSYPREFLSVGGEGHGSATVKFDAESSAVIYLDIVADGAFVDLHVGVVAGHATLHNNGSNYSVTGEGTGWIGEEKGNRTLAFTIDLTCPDSGDGS